MLAVGQAAIDLTPPRVKEFAIATFGADDKTALLGGILVILAASAAMVGMLAVRRLAFGMWGLAIFASIGLAAALTRPTATVGYVVPTLVGAAAGAFALIWLARAAARLASPLDVLFPFDPHPELTGLPQPADPARPAAPRRPPDPVYLAEPNFRAGPAYSSTFLPHPDDQVPSRWPARRWFLFSSGAAAAVAAFGTLAGRNLIDEHSIAATRAALRFPRPAASAPPLPTGSNLNMPGLSSFVTPDDSFYRVDTALLVPQVAPATWRLRIHGMVQREVTITFADLLRRPLIEAYLTLACVSNPVGGPYVGNAKWLGASLAALIRQARPLAGANQLLCTSVDGFTSGTPLQVVLDGRNALLAVAMNGTALPIVHGFPARMVVPGLYGYVSATKWVTDIEVTTFAAAHAYWAQRGWSQQAPIRDRVQNRRTCRRRVTRAGPDSGGRCGLGAAQGHRRRGGATQRRPMARGPAGYRARHRHLAAVGLGMDGLAGQLPDRSSRHRRDRLHPDRRPGPDHPERCYWLPLGRSHGPQLLNRQANCRGCRALAPRDGNLSRQA